jgi:hypothetical protein
MTIHERLMGSPNVSGCVDLLCRVCSVPAQDAKSDRLLKVCPQCGMPLGEWDIEAERDAEIRDFEETVKRASGKSA